jgi:ABC-type lipoprotein export system ATPase subunit
MKISPVVLDSVKTKHTNYIVDIKLGSNIILVAGDSGTGKSAVFSFLQEYASEDKRVRCINFLDQRKQYRTTIKRAKGKLFVIDNADIILDDKIRRYISTDSNYQYILIGRNPKELLLTLDEIYELVSETKDGITTFSLKKAFEM